MTIDPMIGMDEERTAMSLDAASVVGLEALPETLVEQESIGQDALRELVELLVQIQQPDDAGMVDTPPSTATVDDDDLSDDEADAETAEADEEEGEGESPETVAAPAAGPTPGGGESEAGGSSQAAQAYQENGFGGQFGAAPGGEFEGEGSEGFTPPESDTQLVLSNILPPETEPLIEPTPTTPGTTPTDGEEPPEGEEPREEEEERVEVSTTTSGGFQSFVFDVPTGDVIEETQVVA